MNLKKLKKLSPKIILLATGSVFILALVITGVIFFKKNTDTAINDSDIKYNRNENFLEKQEVGGLRFDDIKCTYDGKVSLLTYKITNITDHEISLTSYEVNVKNKKGEVLTTINLNLETKLNASKSIDIANEVNIDITDAYTMEIKI